MPRTPAKKPATVRRPRHQRVPIPRTRDPFVNTPLIAVGADAAGRDRFWTSSYNAVEGCFGVLVDEAGTHRIYRFGKEFPGFYSASAVASDGDTLWLCGTLDVVVRLTLSSGAFTAYPTDAARNLVFQGMILDPPTGKLFMAAYAEDGIDAFSFDTKKKKTVTIHRGFTPDHYMRDSFPNGDGTWSALFQTPGESMVQWDPRTETLGHRVLRTSIDAHSAANSTRRLIADDRGRRYLPGQGWYDPKTGVCETDTEAPRRGVTWVVRHGRTAYGATSEQGDARLVAWDLDRGTVGDLPAVPDCDVLHINLSASGKLIVVNTYGIFHRIDAATGALEMVRELPTDGIGHVDCLCRIDRDRLLGTPFITQRFWEARLSTGTGVDYGRAAPGSGEVLRTWLIGGIVYMAAYTGGELTAYDPRRPARFPENPRVVAKAPGGLRPVANATDGRNLYYACSAGYGKLGSVLTRYDTTTGLATYARDPLPDQKVMGLGYDRKARALLAASTFHADQSSAPPTSRTCHLARIAADDLSVSAVAQAPEGTELVRVIGALGRGRWLCTFSPLSWGTAKDRWAAIAIADLRTPAPEAMRDFPAGYRDIYATPTPGRFVLWINRRVELWDLRAGKSVKTLWPDFDGYRIVVQARSVYLIRTKEIIVIDDCV
ncbi:MAG: hypothetical protein H0W83_12210 [Planctomycetes bacterium]|nr:hypothetical protein [Planctomycetota bacterium]